MAKVYPYEDRINELPRGSEVTIDRRGAPSLKGELDGTEDDGFYLLSDGSQPGMVKRTFVSYNDVCGITEEVHDMRC